MTAPNCCQDRYETIVALVMGELDDREAEYLQEHIKVCDACRSVRDALAAEELQVRDGFSAIARSLEPIERTVCLEIQKRTSQPQPIQSRSMGHVWKGIFTMFLTHKRLSLSAAMLLIAAIGVIAFHAFSPASVAYALEQTSEAHGKITNYHVKITPAGGGLGEAWAQMDGNGELIRMRMDFPKTSDGPKTTFWSKGKANVWFHKKNIFLTVDEPKILQKMKDIRLVFDPKLAFKAVEEQQKTGKAQVETKLPQEDKHPIELVVTYKDNPDRRDTFLVAPQTKLIRNIIRSRRSDGTWKDTTFEYTTYNEPIPEEIWHPKLPADIVRIDQTTQDIGLPQDKLTNDEIAIKVAREFFEALIAKDYAKAGRLYEGIPAEKIKEGFGKLDILRIVSIGKPAPHPDPRTHFLQVPVEVEMMVNGKKVVQKFVPNIRPAYNQPKRWIIGGGI